MDDEVRCTESLAGHSSEQLDRVIMQGSGDL